MIAQEFTYAVTLYADVYSERYDFSFYLEELIVSIARLWFRRKFNGIEEEHADIMKK